MTLARHLRLAVGLLAVVVVVAATVSTAISVGRVNERETKEEVAELARSNSAATNVIITDRLENGGPRSVLSLVDALRVALEFQGAEAIRVGADGILPLVSTEEAPASSLPITGVPISDVLDALDEAERKAHSASSSSATDDLTLDDLRELEQLEVPDPGNRAAPDPGADNPGSGSQGSDGVELTDPPAIDLLDRAGGDEIDVIDFAHDGRLVAMARVDFAPDIVRRVALGTDRVYIVVSRDVGATGLGAFGPGLALVAAGSVFAALIAAELVARRLREPLDRIAATSAEISEGDLSARVGDIQADTEIRQIGATIDELATNLERSGEQRRRFLVDVAHELRTPLTTIVGYGELLSDGRLSESPEVAVAGRATHTEALRMHRLVDDLLVLARLDAGELPMAEEIVDLAAITREVADHLGPRAHEAGVSIAAVAASPSWMSGDRDRVTQILMNLAANALTFANSAVTLEVSAGQRVSPNGSGTGSAPERGADPQPVLHSSEFVVRCAVIDDGPGLGGAEASIFDRTVSERRGDQAVTASAGVGLDIVARLVDAMGGTIRVDDSAAGSRFEVAFPGTTGPS